MIKRQGEVQMGVVSIDLGQKRRGCFWPRAVLLLRVNGEEGFNTGAQMELGKCGREL